MTLVKQAINLKFELIPSLAQILYFMSSQDKPSLGFQFSPEQSSLVLSGSKEENKYLIVIFMCSIIIIFFKS